MVCCFMLLLKLLNLQSSYDIILVMRINYGHTKPPARIQPYNRRLDFLYRETGVLLLINKEQFTSVFAVLLLTNSSRLYWLQLSLQMRLSRTLLNS